MFKLAAAASLLAGLAIAGTSQPPASAPDQQYLFIDARTTRSRLTRIVNVSKLRERLAAAVAQGYNVQWVAASSASLNLLLERGDADEGSHLLVANSSEGSFLKELNEAASNGFRMIAPDGIKAFEESSGFGRQTTWIAVLARQPEASRVRYSVVKGASQGEQALAAAAGAGRRLVAILGRQGLVAANALLFFEENPGAEDVLARADSREYRIVSTSLTSTMQKELREAAAAGFHVIGAGFGYMTVVMERDPESTAEPFEYQLNAIRRIQTGARELQAAGAEGFQVVASSEHGEEAVFILQRQPSVSGRFEYRLVRLEEATANQTLIDAEAEGYRIVRLLSDWVLLERQSAPPSPDAA